MSAGLMLSGGRQLTNILLASCRSNCRFLGNGAPERQDLFTNVPVREKTNNLGPDQVQHKPGCTVTEDG